MNWLLCDYGEVLALAPSSADRAALETQAGADGEEFWFAYWRHRPAYDRDDLDTASYWAAVLGKVPHPRQIRRLVEADVVMWSRPNAAVLSAVGRAKSSGVKLAVLSNAPRQLADHFEALSWLEGFSPRLFSGRLGMTKPEPAIYDVALHALRTEASDVTFLDDRQENVDAARDAGMGALLFRDARQIEEIYR